MYESFEEMFEDKHEEIFGNAAEMLMESLLDLARGHIESEGNEILADIDAEDYEELFEKDQDKARVAVQDDIERRLERIVNERLVSDLSLVLRLNK